jgi:putative molybdopterin biosynthesis protein
MYSVEFAYNIVPSDEAGQGLSNLLIRQLAAIESGKGLQQAARSLGVSYRYFWGQIEIWEERFGQKLVIREQGKRARLSPLGQKLLWAERTVMANYAVQMEKMRTELNAAFAAACNPDADIVTIAGCFDPWLATLPAFLFPSHPSHPKSQVFLFALLSDPICFHHLKKIVRL